MRPPHVPVVAFMPCLADLILSLFDGRIIRHHMDDRDTLATEAAKEKQTREPGAIGFPVKIQEIEEAPIDEGDALPPA